MPWTEINRRYDDNEPEFYQPEVWRGRRADMQHESTADSHVSYELIRRSAQHD